MTCNLIIEKRASHLDIHSKEIHLRRDDLLIIEYFQLGFVLGHVYTSILVRESFSINFFELITAMMLLKNISLLFWSCRFDALFIRSYT